MSSLARIAALLLLAAPAVARGLEPRFDHRDQRGPLAALEAWRESVAVPGLPTRSELRPRLRLGWGFDLSGEGDELVTSVSMRLGDWRDEAGWRYLLGADVRYRGYFGAEELKSFFELGLSGELRSRLAVGPLVGVGLAYDPSRRFGAFASVHFGTAFGDARVVSFGGSAGVQLRFE